MRNVKRAACALLALLLAGAWLCAAGVADYSVRPIPPACQEDQDAWYYDFPAQPGEQIVLQAIIMNANGHDIEVAVEANAGSTNCNGLIVFDEADQKDPSMAVDFGEICVPVEPVVSVPAMGQAMAEFTLTMPEEPIEGILYGGFLFTMLGQGAQEGQDGMGVSNVFRYAVGARVRQSEQPVEPAFELTGAALDRESIPALVLNLRNPVPALARGIALRVSLYPEGSDEPAATFERNSLDMAPNTLMPLRIELMESQMPAPGNYHVSAELQFGERTWAMEAPLTVE